MVVLLLAHMPHEPRPFLSSLFTLACTDRLKGMLCQLLRGRRNLNKLSVRSIVVLLSAFLASLPHALLRSIMALPNPHKLTSPDKTIARASVLSSIRRLVPLSRRSCVEYTYIVPNSSVY